jgi:protein arginine kinase
VDESYEPSLQRGWFSASDSDQDVVVSSRVRLSRNLTDFVFPEKLNQDQKKNVFNRISDRIFSLPVDERYFPIFIENLDDESKKILLERNLITTELEKGPGTGMFLREDEALSVLINDIDHLRLVGLRSGLCLEETYRLVAGLDMQLEKDLDYAVSLELGYLSPEIINSGTGLRASVMVHLPGLVRSSLIDDAFLSLPESEFTIKGFKTKKEQSLGDMYQISNKFALGLSEEEILKKLESGISQLVHYEKAARDELLDTKQSMLEDLIGRALGVLKFSRLIEYKEAAMHLSLIRLGVSMGLIKNTGLSEITALFFLLQDHHVLKHAGFDMNTPKKNEEDESKMSIINWERSMMIRKALRVTDV